MSLTFDQGNQDQPRGHAVLYYRSGVGYAATYVVVLPIDVDLAKYVPPVFANQIKMSGMEEFAAFAMPPMPESAASYEFLQELAYRRSDDLICGGEVSENDFMESAQRVNDDVQEYAQLCRQTNATSSAIGEADSPAGLNPDLAVHDVMYSLMSEKDRLHELTKLVGKLKFAVEGPDQTLVDEAALEMQAIAKYLPDNYNVTQIIESSRLVDPENSSLTQLYLERCYKLADADYSGLANVEQAIKDLTQRES